MTHITENLPENYTIWVNTNEQGTKYYPQRIIRKYDGWKDKSVSIGANHGYKTERAARKCIADHAR